jgi:hypothetical protein
MSAAKPLTTAEVKELHLLHAELHETRVAVDRAQLLATTEALEAAQAEVARLVAESGNCEHSQDEDACGECAACLRVALGAALRARGEVMAHAEKAERERDEARARVELVEANLREDRARVAELEALVARYRLEIRAVPGFVECQGEQTEDDDVMAGLAITMARLEHKKKGGA